MRHNKKDREITASNNDNGAQIAVKIKYESAFDHYAFCRRQIEWTTVKKCACEFL
jgi:hypothetical protein